MLIRYTKSDVPFMPTYVYVLECDGFAKIGVATDPARRLHNLQLCCPLKLQISSQRLFENLREAVAVERQLHATFADRRTWGEWFAMPAIGADNMLLTFREYVPPAIPEPEPLPMVARTEDEERLLKALDF